MFKSNHLILILTLLVFLSTGFSSLVSAQSRDSGTFDNSQTKNKVAIKSGSSREPEYDAFDKAEAKEREVYVQVLHDYRADKVFIEKLKASEAAWSNYVISYLNSRFPDSDPLHTYGSSWRLCCAIMRTELDEARTKQLRQWLDGVEDGDCCAGSIHTKK